MRTQIEGYLKDDDFSENLQDGFFSIRGERYVLPVKSSHRGRVPGIIHNASNSGETVFVEPQALVGLGNELTIAQSLVEEEERRILAEFSRDIGDVADDLETAMNLLAQVDYGTSGRSPSGLDGCNGTGFRSRVFMEPQRHCGIRFWCCRVKT